MATDGARQAVADYCLRDVLLAAAQVAAQVYGLRTTWMALNKELKHQPDNLPLMP